MLPRPQQQARDWLTRQLRQACDWPVDADEDEEMGVITARLGVRCCMRLQLGAEASFRPYGMITSDMTFSS